MSSSREEQIGKAAEVLRQFGQPLLSVLTAALPFLIENSRKAYKIWIQLPLNTVQIIIGLIFCFFGGLYPTLFAVVQAIKVSGFSTLQEALMDLHEEATVVLEANKKDDELDKDRNGKTDIKQIDAKVLLLRKVNIVMTKINPQKVDRALGTLYKIWAAVIATLTIQFARTIALAVSISDAMRKPIHIHLEPTINRAVPKGYERWVPVVIGWITKSIAISIAWYIQTIISAVTSALQGSVMVSHALLTILMQRGITLGGLVKPKDDENKIDEVLAGILAVVGFYFQFSVGFDIEFPFNIPLLPFEVAEQYLRWTLAKIQT